MQIVIDIPEYIYNLCQGHGDIVYRYVANGTPLPKGHGNLIEAEKLESRMYHEAFETDSDMQKWDSGCWIRYKMFEQNIQEAETIIEADKEGEEGCK